MDQIPYLKNNKLDKTSVDVLHTSIKENKGLSQYTSEELKYVQKPLGKAIYKCRRPKKEDSEKCHWSDKVKCDTCGKTFMRSARTAHNNTNFHKIHIKMNDKLKKLLIE